MNNPTIQKMYSLVIEGMKKERAENLYENQLKLYNKLFSNEESELICARCLVSLSRYISEQSEEIEPRAKNEILNLEPVFNGSALKRTQIKEILQKRIDSLSSLPSSTLVDSILFLCHSLIESKEV